jgi:hypothetical protein
VQTIIRVFELAGDKVKAAVAMTLTQLIAEGSAVEEEEEEEEDGDDEVREIVCLCVFVYVYVRVCKDQSPLHLCIYPSNHLTI